MSYFSKFFHNLFVSLVFVSVLSWLAGPVLAATTASDYTNTGAPVNTVGRSDTNVLLMDITLYDPSEGAPIHDGTNTPSPGDPLSITWTNIYYADADDDDLYTGEETTTEEETGETEGEEEETGTPSEETEGTDEETEAGEEAAEISVTLPYPEPTTLEEAVADLVYLQGILHHLQDQLRELTGLEAVYVFNQDLYYGMSNDSVRNLQTVLETDSTVYPEGLVTGYFGPLTEAAVVRFQEKYREDILTPLGLSAGTGYVGSSTRAKLNALFGGE
jgi:hypothetical protein